MQAGLIVRFARWRCGQACGRVGHVGDMLGNTHHSLQAAFSRTMRVTLGEPVSQLSINADDALGQSSAARLRRLRCLCSVVGVLPADVPAAPAVEPHCPRPNRLRLRILPIGGTSLVASRLCIHTCPLDSRAVVIRTIRNPTLFTQKGADESRTNRPSLGLELRTKVYPHA